MEICRIKIEKRCLPIGLLVLNLSITIRILKLKGVYRNIKGARCRNIIRGGTFG